MTLGPYRSAAPRPATCSKHAGELVIGVCRRCRGSFCGACGMLGCDRCARCEGSRRRRGEWLRAAIGAVMALLGASLPLHALSWGAEPETSVQKLYRRAAIRSSSFDCREDPLLLVITSLQNDGREQELVALADPWVERCGPGKHTGRLAAAARARLAEP